MIYLTKEQALFANDGRFIKRIRCPLASKLARAVSLAEPEREFHCAECSTSVKNLRFLTDDLAIDAVLQDSSVCFFATEQATNVIHLTPQNDQEWRSENRYRTGLTNDVGNDWPMIRTARGIEEMNFAIRNGFKVIPRKIEVRAGARGSIALYQDVESGKFFYVDDRRFGWLYEADSSSEGIETSRFSLAKEQVPLEVDVERRAPQKIFDFFRYSRDEPVPPVAGYVIPQDLPAGSRVFLDDVIEHLIQEYPQGSAERLPSWWGTWTGDDIQLDRFAQDVIIG